MISWEIKKKATPVFPRSRQLRGLLLTTLLQRSQGTRLLGLLQLLDNGVLQSVGFGESRPPSHDMAISRDKELLKVPLDPLQPHHARRLLLQPSEDRRGAVTVDIQLAQDGECDAIVQLAEGLDVVVRAGVLVVELVAREAEDGEVVGVAALQGLVELFKTFELGREAAFRGGVDNKHNFALQRGEVEGFAFLYWGRPSR